MTPTTAPDQTGAAALESGATLPATWYTDPAYFAREQERIFRRSWQYVGLTEQVANAGDFFTARAGDVPIVVARDQQGTLRGHVNVCRHRGSQLVNAEQGNRKTLQCGYHAWTYNLDGSLRAAPGMRDEPRLRHGLLLARSGAGGGVGAVHLRQPRPRGAAALPRAGRSACDGQRDGTATRRDPAPGASHV